MLWKWDKEKEPMFACASKKAKATNFKDQKKKSKENTTEGVWAKDSGFRESYFPLNQSEFNHRTNDTYLPTYHLGVCLSLGLCIWGLANQSS